MKVCLLTKVEVHRLQNYGEYPSHNDHSHIPIEEAANGIASDELRIVGDGRGNEVLLDRPAVTESDSNNRTWKSRPSDGVNVRQFVRIVQG